MAEIHVGDVGTVIEVTVKENNVIVDISTATVKKFYFYTPSNEVVEKTAVFSTTGVDGKLRYVLEAGVIDEAGQWYFQVALVMPTWTGRSNRATFEVEAIIL